VNAPGCPSPETALREDAAGITEGQLADLGVHRIAVPVPFPQAGGPVNVYLVEEADGGISMIDAGLGKPDAEAALAEGFARLGRRFDEVARIVLTHGHIDHYGGAVTVMERAGRPIPVYVHPADAEKVAASGRRWRDLFPAYRAHLARLGVPDDALAAISQEVGGGFTLARRIPEVLPLTPGEVLRGRDVALEVLHMPGHTPGQCCLHERRRGLFFSADHLLEKVSPNPIIEVRADGEPAWRPLVAYLASLARLRALDVDLVLPGHGPPFGRHREVIDSLLAFYRKRQDKIRGALASAALTGYEVTRALFPWAGAGDLFLVVSETAANLEVMEAAAEVARDEVAGVYRYRLAG
jgi:glyoxylase-like metal-dependent hydrolase (beta-lactamase superfamily II)